MFKMVPSNYESRIEPRSYKEEVFAVLLARLRTCDSTDALNFVIAINELYNPSDLSYEFEKEYDEDVVAEDPNKRHWTNA